MTIGPVAPAALALAALLAVAAGLAAAPALRDRPDTITGTLATQEDSPVLRLDDECGTVLWLVFADDESESRLLAHLGDGDRVKVGGRLATGGKFRYAIVRTLAKEE